MTGFPSPNYTQTPNDFFSMVPDMEESELRVTVVMIRQTFGFHRDGFKMAVGKLAKAAGLSRQGALDGAKAAENRGTFRRSNPDEQGEAEWELVVSPLHSVDTPLQPVEGTPLMSESKLGVKENLKKELNGDKSPEDEFPIEWQLGHGKKIVLRSEEDEFRALAKDTSNLIDMGAAGTGPLALAFMLERKILIPHAKVKGNRKAAREMMEMKVKPDHVRDAVRQLVSNNMTVVDLFGVSKTAIALANPAPEGGNNPLGLEVGT